MCAASTSRRCAFGQMELWANRVLGKSGRVVSAWHFAFQRVAMLSTRKHSEMKRCSKKGGAFVCVS